MDERTLPIVLFSWLKRLIKMSQYPVMRFKIIRYNLLGSCEVYYVDGNGWHWQAAYCLVCAIRRESLYL